MPESLSQRLRAIREAAQQPKSRPVPTPASTPAPAPASASATTPVSSTLHTTPRQTFTDPANQAEPSVSLNSNIPDDEIERLIRLTQDEVHLDRQSGLGSEEAEEEGVDPAGIENPDIETQASLPPGPSQRETSNLLSQSKGLLGQAERLQSSTPTQPASSTGQRSKPILTRGSSSRLKSQDRVSGSNHQEADVEDDSADLADDLAEALGEEVTRRPVAGLETEQQLAASSSSPPGAREIQVQDGPGSSRAEELEPEPKPELEPDEIQDEVDALIARFSALRPARQATPSEQAPSSSPARSSPSSPPPAYTSDDSEGEGEGNSGSRDPFAAFSLPSVPSSEPTIFAQTSAPSAPAIHPTLGPAHNDLPADLDLAPFRRLVGRELDVRRLDEPSERERSFDGFPSVPSSGSTSHPSKGGQVEEEEEETFCSICSAPPTLSCFSPRDPEDEGCMGDVYCSECWVQAHEGMEREELREHRTRDLPRKGGVNRGGPKRKGGSGGGRKPLAA